MGGPLVVLPIGFFIAGLLLMNGLRGGAGELLGVDEGLVKREMGGAAAAAAGERSLVCDWKMHEGQLTVHYQNISILNDCLMRHFKLDVVRIMEPAITNVSV